MRHQPIMCLALLSIAAATLPACSSDPAPDMAGAALQTVVTGLDFPLLLTAPAGDARLFIVEKEGRIKVVKDGALLASPFLDVSALLSQGTEQGLLGLAFSPDYATSGRFFISYTNLDGDNVLASYLVSSSNPDRADAASAVIRLTVPQPYDNHNGGHITFGRDGYLYMGIGDGGGAADPDDHGQDRSELLGSILRLDVSGASGYQVPADNPLVGVAGTRDELWNWGLRNPWRFSFDRVNGDLYIGDVGQAAREEVDVSTATSGAGRGLNYGWSIMEGSACYGGGSCVTTGLTLPALDYSHDEGCTVVGGYVYRGSAIPDLDGTYFYADYCAGWVRSFRYVNGAAEGERQWPALAPTGTISSFGEDGMGELYVLSGGGGVYRIVPE